MKIIGKKGNHNDPFIVEVGWWEMGKLAGGDASTRNIAVGDTVEISNLYNHYHDLKRTIKLAGTDSPRNLRALADLLEAQVEPVTQPEEGK